MTSLFGEITYKRRTYRHEDCGRDHARIDMSLGRVRRGTGGVALLISHLSSELPIARVEKILKSHHQIDLSAGTIDNISKEIGVRLKEMREKEEAELLKPVGRDKLVLHEEHIDKNEVHVTETDAVKVRFTKEEGGWHDVKVCLCDRLGEKRNKGTGFKEMKGPRRYIAEWTDVDSFAPRVKALALETGLRGAKEAIFLGDGADWIDKISREEMGWAERILDYYHAKSHIYKASCAAVGEENEQAKKKADEWSGCLFESKGVETLCKKIEDEIVKLPTAEKERRGKLKLVYEYIKRHEKGLNYKEFRDKGWIIGSGAIEGGGCKTLIEQRFKRSGQTWSKEGFHKMLALRTTVENEQWDKINRAIHIYPSQNPRRTKICMMVDNKKL